MALYFSYPSWCSLGVLFSFSLPPCSFQKPCLLLRLSVILLTAPHLSISHSKPAFFLPHFEKLSLSFLLWFCQRPMPSALSLHYQANRSSYLRSPRLVPPFKTRKRLFVASLAEEWRPSALLFFVNDCVYKGAVTILHRPPTLSPPALDPQPLPFMARRDGGLFT